MLISSPLHSENGIVSENDMLGRIMLEKNGKSLDFPFGEVSTDRITAIQVPISWLSPVLFLPHFLAIQDINNHIYGVQEAYWSMASALSEADGIDYTDPEEVHISMYLCS